MAEATEAFASITARGDMKSDDYANQLVQAATLVDYDLFAAQYTS